MTESERADRSRRGVRILQWVSLVVALAFIGWVLAANRDELTLAFSLTPAVFASISVLALLEFVLNGLELKVLTRGFDTEVPHGDAFSIGLMVSVLNYLPLKAGTVLNGVVLKSRYSLPLSEFASLIAASNVIHLWTAAALAGGALVLGGEPRTGVALIGVPTLGVIGLIVWGRRRSAGWLEGHDSRLVRAAGRAVDGLGHVFATPRLLAAEAAINLAIVLLTAGRMAVALDAVSARVSFGRALVVSSIGIIASLLSVVPRGLGFKEGGAAAGAVLARVSAAAGFAASVVERAVTLVWLLALGVPATLHQRRLLASEGR
jgi:hypothetical protein